MQGGSRCIVHGVLRQLRANTFNAIPPALIQVTQQRPRVQGTQLCVRVGLVRDDDIGTPVRTRALITPCPGGMQWWFRTSRSLAASIRAPACYLPGVGELLD